MGINDNVSQEKVNAAVEIMKYTSTNDFQKNVVIKNKLLPAMKSMYDDEEVCQIVDCKLLKNVQILPQEEINKVLEYSNEFRHYMNDFLYGDESAAKTLENINNIFKIYTISLDTKDSYVGLIVFIIITILFTIMLGSLSFLYIPKFKPYFQFLTKDFWILIVLGTVFGLSTILTLYGDMAPYKCHLNYLFISFSSCFRIIPILHKLISNFPSKFKFIEWVSKNRYAFLSIFLLFNTIINLIYYIIKYTVIDVIIPYGKNYQLCVVLHPLGNTLGLITTFEKYLEILIIVLLLFMEWSIEKTKEDIKSVTCAFGMDSLIFILISMFNFIQFKDYYAYFIISSLLTILISLSNFIWLYGARISRIIKTKKDPMDTKAIESQLLKYKPSLDTRSIVESTKCETDTIKSNSTTGSIIQKVVSYHYYTGEEKDKNESGMVLPMPLLNDTNNNIGENTIINGKNNRSNSPNNTGKKPRSNSNTTNKRLRNGSNASAGGRRNSIGANTSGMSLRRNSIGANTSGMNIRNNSFGANTSGKNIRN